MFSSSLTISQTFSRASRTGVNLFKSATFSALALTALAGGVMLSGGEAKASQCFFNFGFAPVGPNCQTWVSQWTPSNPVATDKEIWLFDVPSNAATGSNHIEFTWQDVNNNGTWTQPADHGVDEWHVDVDFKPDLSLPYLATVNLVSVFQYALKITDPKLVFKDIALGTLVTPGNYTTLKQVFAATLDGAGAPVCGAEIANLTNPPNPDGWDPIGSQVICVKDSVTIPAGSTARVDTYQNVLRQTPAPFPLLGGAAALGFSRKLRGRVKAARLA